MIVFTVYDGINSGSDSLTLPVTTVDDNPTNVSRNERLSKESVKYYVIVLFRL